MNVCLSMTGLLVLYAPECFDVEPCIMMTWWTIMSSDNDTLLGQGQDHQLFINNHNSNSAHGPVLL